MTLIFSKLDLDMTLNFKQLYMECNYIKDKYYRMGHFNPMTLVSKFNLDIVKDITTYKLKFLVEVVPKL